MGEFDLSLIREFRSRPAFYDRNEPRFKDKIYTAHEWQEISYKLGYDVSLLKDRMLQLRNRYNLEKRRLEQMHEENPDKPAESAWPLYDQLRFLSEHIRARRSYKRMQPRVDALGNVTAELSNSGSNPSSLCGNSVAAAAAAAAAANVIAAADCQASMPYANGMLAVKMEEVSEDEHAAQTAALPDADAESVSQSGADHAAFAPLSEQLNASALGLASNASFVAAQLSASLPPSITIRRLDTMRDNAVLAAGAAAAAAAAAASPKKALKRSHPDTKANRAQFPHHQQQEQQQQQQQQQPFVPPSAAQSTSAKRFLSAREQKYAAFGHFMSASLLELPAARALQLVEKFTSEVVGVLLQKSDAAMAASASCNGDLNAQ